MDKYKSLTSLALGLFASGGALLLSAIWKVSRPDLIIFAAAVSFLAGFYSQVTMWFFAGVALAVIGPIVSIYLFVDSYDQFKIMIGTPLLMIGMLCVTGLSSLIGKVAQRVLYP